jgi:prepilin-type processing-associated H-X9-DG protein
LDSAAKTDYSANGGTEWINFGDLMTNSNLSSIYSSGLSTAPITTVETFLANKAHLTSALAVLEGGGGKNPGQGYGTGSNEPGPCAYPGANGASYVLSTVRVDQIKDGTSNTFLLGEKYQDPAGYEAMVAGNSSGSKPGYGDYPALCNQVNTSTRFTNGLKYSISLTGTPYRDTYGWLNYHGFGSIHAGGYNMAMCDGSVRQVSYALDNTVADCLASRKDGKAIDPSSLSF